MAPAMPDRTDPRLQEQEESATSDAVVAALKSLAEIASDDTANNEVRIEAAQAILTHSKSPLIDYPDEEPLSDQAAVAAALVHLALRVIQQKQNPDGSVTLRVIQVLVPEKV